MENTKPTSDTQAQKVLLHIEASREEGAEQTSLRIQLETECSGNFLANIFHQLFKQDETLKEIVYTVVMKDMMSGLTEGLIEEMLAAKHTSNGKEADIFNNVKAQA